MIDILYFIVVGIVGYIFYRKLNGQTITGKKKVDTPNVVGGKTKKKGRKQKGKTLEEIEQEEEAELFRSLLDDIQEIENHMIRYDDNTFVLVAEAYPVN